MHKKLLCTIAAVAMLSGLLVVGATPAQAAPPTDTHNFAPDDTNKTAASVGNVLSDRFDGTDTVAHLTNVATAEATRVQWRLCPVGTVAGPDETITQAQFDSCTIVIGEDSSGTTPVGDPPTDVDQAFDITWDIPGSEDGATRDLVAAACIGAGEDVEDDAVPAGDESNCTVDVENDVVLDDSSTGAIQTTTGEIVSLCTDDVGGPAPGDPDDACVLGEGGTDAEVDARFDAFGHGDNIPNDGFVLRATTSEDVTALTAIVGPGDAETDPQTATGTGTCADVFTGTNFIEWECQFVAGAVPDDSELHLTLIEAAGGSGACGAVACELDSHYVVSNDRRPTTASAFFDAGNFGPPEDVDDDSSCDTPDQEDTSFVGNEQRVRGCVLDQFGSGNKIVTPVTFESAEGFVDCSGSLEDHDGDGIFEHCHDTTADGATEYWVDIYQETPGDQSVLFCSDSEQGDPTSAEHGCADESVTDSVEHHWIAGLADEVTLVFPGTGQDGTDECLTGATFRQTEEGDTDPVKACTFDGFGNPATTSIEDAGFLEWSIDTGFDDDVDTQYQGLPPSETDGDGHATADVRSTNQGTDFPTVCLRDDTGDTLDCDSVQVNVTESGAVGSSTISIKHKTGPHRFKGRVSSNEDSCVAGRDVVLKKKKSGKDKTVGTDTTNANGKYSIDHKKTNKKKKYYSRVKATADCGGDKSKTLKKK